MSTIPALLLSLTLAATPNPRGEVIDFSATWCGPCQEVAPIVHKLEREGHSIRTVDVDADQATAEKYNVSAMPTFVLVVNGREVERHVGKMTEQQLRSWLAKIPQSEAGNVAPVSNGAPVAVESPTANRPRPFVADPNVDLGAPTPFARSVAEGNSRPAPIESIAQPAAPPAAPRKSPIWPFGRSEQPVAPPEVRGNDDRLGQVSLDAPEGLTAEPMQSSVRLRVTIGSSVNLGSGTIVYSVPGRALIVTCGHIFRGVTEDSKIEVDLLHGTEKQTVVGRVVDFDIDSEIGLIEIPSAELLPFAAVATIQSTLAVGDRVLSIGCDGGALPTAMPIEVTAIDRYEGPSTIECTGLPVQGRSGGGLFNNDGELVGVCFAADPKSKRGIYTGLSVIQSSLRDVGLARLFELPTSPATAPGSLADSSSDQNRIPGMGRNNLGEAAPDVSSLFSNEPGPSRQPVAPGTESDVQGTAGDFSSQRDGLLSDRRDSGNLDMVDYRDRSAQREGRGDSASRTAEGPDPFGSMAGDAEIVVIVRPKNQPEEASRVVIIHEASPKLLAYLRGDAQNSSSSPNVQTAATTLRRPQPLATQVPQSLHSSQVAAAPPVRASKEFIVPTTASRPREPQRYVRSATRQRESANTAATPR